MKINITDPRKAENNQVVIPKAGDIIEWIEGNTITDLAVSLNPCLVCHKDIVSLVDFKIHWTPSISKINFENYLADLIKKDQIRIVPRGYKVELTQE